MADQATSKTTKMYHPTIPDVVQHFTSDQIKEAKEQGWLSEPPKLDKTDVVVERDGGGSRPKESAPKADWIEYAVAGGVDRATAEDPSTTKADLIAMTSTL